MIDAEAPHPLAVALPVAKPAPHMGAGQGVMGDTDDRGEREPERGPGRKHPAPSPQPHYDLVVLHLAPCPYPRRLAEAHLTWAGAGNAHFQAARNFAHVSGRASGSTRTSATEVMKFVSPIHRGTMWTCRWSGIPAPAARPRFKPMFIPSGR